MLYKGLRYALLTTLAMGVAACDDDPPAGTADANVGGMGGDAGGAGGDAGGAGGTGGMGPACTTDADCVDARYCDRPADDPFADGTCLPGCRTDPDSCGDGEACDAETRECRSLGCQGDDTQCAEDEYCDAETNACATGCRTSPDDNCPLQEGGRDGQCDEATRTCEALFVCCSADNACSTAPQGACEGRELGEATTCDDNPCDATQCANNDECADGEYCNVADGICLSGCRVDERCPNDGNLVCDGETHTCAEAQCNSDDDCALDFHYCNQELNLCREGDCRVDADCEADFGAGWSCVTGQCLNVCDADADCGEGRYCDGDQRTCRDECADHDACEDNEACNFDNNQCERGLCRDDAHEPNDAVNAATAVPVGEPVDGIRHGGLDELIMCYDDTAEGSSISEDYYAIELGQGERLRVVLLNPGVGEGNLDLELLGDEVEDELISATLEGSESIEFPPANDVRNATTYYARVSGDLEEAADYSIQVTIVDSGDACFPDAREPGDNTWNGATGIDGDQARFAGTICSGDEDWFSLNMGRSDGLQVELTTPATSAELTISLYSETTLNGIGGLANPAHTAGEPRLVGGRMIYDIEVPVGASGFTNDTWYVRVDSAAADGIADYDLNIQHRRDANECVPDPLGGNETFNTGINLDADDDIAMNGQVVENVEHEVFNNAQMCPDDVDYFCLTAADADILEAWLVSDGALGAINVQWVDDQDQGVGSQASQTAMADPVDKAIVAGVSAGRYCARVDGVAVAEGPYSLFIQRRVVEEGMCAQDIAELNGRNDTSRTATIMSSPAEGIRYEEAVSMMCDPGDTNDVDWFTFPVAPPESRVCVTVSGFDNNNANLNVALYREDQAGEACANDAGCDGGACVNGRCQPIVPGGQSSTSFDVEMIDISGGVVGNRVGEYFPRVSHSGEPGATEAYSITATVIPPIARRDECPNDWQEVGQQNGSRAEAVPLGLGQVALCDTWLCRNEVPSGDWFEVTVPANEDRTVLVEYPRAQGTVQLLYQGPVDGGEDDGIGAVTTATNYQCLNIRGGSVDRPVAVVMMGALFAGDAERIDYSLRVVPTNLDADPQGECITLGAVNIPACDAAEQAAANQNMQNCFPIFTLP